MIYAPSMSDTPMERRLFGRPGDEVLYDSAAEVWETYEDQFEEDPLPNTIEEWSVTKASDMLPSPDTLIEYLLERWVADETAEDGWDLWNNAGGNLEVVGAFQAAIDLLGSKVHYCIADKLLAEHVLTIVDGEPHLDGEPMCIKVQP